MGILTKLHIKDLDGAAADEIKKEVLAASYAKRTLHPAFGIAANTKTEVDFGSVATADMVVVIPSTSVTVQVYKDRSPESWSCDEMFCVVGASITALSLKAASACTCWVFLGGA